MKMLFTETAMHVLTSIIYGLAIVISVWMMVAVSRVIVTKHWVRGSVTVVVSIPIHHRRQRRRSSIVGVAWVRGVALHCHWVLTMVMANRGIWVVANIIPTTVAVHWEVSRSVLVLKEQNIK